MTLRSKKCFDGFTGNFWYFSLFRQLLLFFVLCQRHALSERRIKRRTHGDIGRAPCQLLQLGEQRPLGVFRHLPAEIEAEDYKVTSIQ